jgi:hypothetical protein
MVEVAMDVGVVVAIGVLSAVFIVALIALVVVLKKRYCKPVDLISQQYRDAEPDTDLVGNMEGLSENPVLELDDVGLNRNLDEILSNEVWASDAAGLMPHCLAILKTAHQLTDKLVAVTLADAQQLKFPETLTDLVAVARRIGTRVDDVVRALYPPLDPRLLEARCSSLMLSVSHLAMLAKSSSSLSGVLDWVDQSLADVEEHLKVLSEASLAYESGLRSPTQPSPSTSSAGGPVSGAAAGPSSMDAWEKFSINDDDDKDEVRVSPPPQQLTVCDVARESSQV